VQLESAVCSLERSVREGLNKAIREGRDVRGEQSHEWVELSVEKATEFTERGYDIGKGARKK